MNDIGPLLVLAFAGFLFLVFLSIVYLFANLLGLWIRAMLAGAPVSALTLVAMKLRRSPCAKILDAYIQIVQSGCRVHLAEVERAALCGVDLEMVTLAYIELQRSDNPMHLEDLVFEAQRNRLRKLLDESSST